MRVRKKCRFSEWLFHSFVGGLLVVSYWPDKKPIKILFIEGIIILV